MKRKLFLSILILSVLLGLILITQTSNRAVAAGPLCYVDDTALGLNDGSSWVNAFTNLQSALTDIGCIHIEVAQGTYAPTTAPDRTATFLLRSGVEIYGGYPDGGGTRDPSTYVTILSGFIVMGPGTAPPEPYYSYHVVTGSGADSSAVLDGFTIQDGMANGGETNGLGGGVYIDTGSPTLQNLVIQGNSALESGGGMYLFDSSPTLTNVAFRNNEASMSGSWGGGLSVYSVSHPAMSQVEFTDNSAWNGGGMYCEGAWNIQLTDSTFQGNVAYQGGGLNLDYCGIDLANVTFGSNIAYGIGGGGMYTLNGTSGFSPTLSGVSFINNYSDSSGGGLYSYSGDLILYDATFDGNQASNGAGLYIDSTYGNFTNLTVTNNQADLGTGSGGGIYAYYGPAPIFTNLLLAGNSAWRGGGMANYNYMDPEIVNATIYGNQASDSGSAIFNYQSSPSLTNVIVWGNTETVPGPDIVNSGPASLPAIAASILEDGCPGGATCSGIIISDPLFVDAASGNLRLQAASPAIDAGNKTALPADAFDLDGDADLAETIPYDLSGNRRIVLERVDLGAYETQLWNINWTEAAPLPLVEGLPDVQSIEIDRYLDRMGQSRWFTFTVKPDSKVFVTLTGLPANYDLTLYKDIAQVYQELNSPQDLVQLSAEFAPDTFSPDTFSPDTFSPDTFSPDTYSPDTFSPDTYSPDTFSPDTYSPDTFSPDTFSSAQTRSLIAVSAYEGTSGEGIMVNTWTRSGDFYVRVRGRNGAYDPDAPFHLQVIHLSGVCGPVSPLLPLSNTQPPDGEYETLILTNIGKTEGTPDEIATLQANLAALAAETNGWVVDVGADNRVSAAALQAESNPACVYAKNLEAYAVKEIVDGFRALNPLEYIVLVGNDQAIPFFRYRDNSLLASEMGYSPPVRDNTTSQASLKSGYILTQDTYAAGIELSTKAYELPLPDLAIGRLVETASDINQVLAAYLATGNGIVYPTNALVTGYDFLEDVANAVRDELQAGLGGTVVDTLIMSSALSPEDPLAWTATDLQDSLLGSDHDLVFLAGHFSASGALAADYKTHLWTSDVLASATDFTGDLIYSAGCHSGYNIVNAHDVPNGTIEPDWAQTFAAKGATFIGGTGYQYGDTEFIEYSERLYLEFTRQLRYGSGPVAVGKALAQAKQVYLANTPLMRGIHEKSLLEATLFGLPMMQVALPFQATAPVDETIVGSTDLFATDPGNQLGLEYADIHLTSVVTETTIPLDVLSQSGGDPTQVIASYLQGPDGVVVNAAEPVLPLDMLNVTHPISSSFVLRGIGWRGGDYTDLPDRLPLTGAATQDLRAPHPAFFSDIFYPVRAWNVNYFDALSSSVGPTRLAWMPAQYRSSSPGSMTGILRRFDAADFRLYYSGNISSYTTSEPTWTNTPALSAPPDISRIMSTINPDGTVSFEVTVVGDPAAGIQEVWIVYTGESGSLYGAWFPLDLVRDPVDTRLWRGTLSSADTPVADLRFIVQAANGVGLVTMMTNEGAYYRAGVEPGAPPLGETPVMLELETPPASGEFGGQASFTSVLTTLDGAGQSVPLAGVPVAFHLGGQGRMALTGSDGRATASFFLLALPDEYALTAAFYGNETYAPASDSSYFEVLAGTSALSLFPATSEVFFGASTQFTATLTSGGLPVSLKPVALTLVDGGATAYTRVATTDYAGQARWDVPSQPLGSYTVTAWFGLPVSAELDLSTPFYNGASSSASLVVYPLDFSQVFSGFLPPVDDPPVVNKVKAGSAVPVKFSLGGDFGLDIFADGYPTTVINACEGGITSVVEETVSAGESDLIYDPLTGEYTYVWKTDKKWAGTCQTLVLQFVDGTQVFALFQFTK